MMNLLKLSVWFVAVGGSSAASLLRGFQEYLTEQNSCANRRNPMNCLDCRGVPAGADKCTSEVYSVPYSCDEGQEFCCTVSNIRQTDFDKPETYGQCVADNCLPDGSAVTMNLYVDGTDEQRPMSDLEDQCCSGTVSEVECMSSISEGDLPSGSCSGVCGPEETVKSR